MAVKIRLMRIGAKKRPFYRIVAVDERHKRTGGYLELLGTYNPLTTPKEIILKQDRIDEWVKNGAIASDGYLRILGKAPQKIARGPKKPKPEAKPKTEKVEESTAKSTVEDTKTEETSNQEEVKESKENTEETPVEETKAEEAAAESEPSEVEPETKTEPEAPKEETETSEKEDK